MGAYLIRFQLEPGPADKLPLSTGFMEAAEEVGLLWVIRARGRVHALPAGMVWGEFADARAALKAFRRALERASVLLGFEARAPRALAASFDLEFAPRAGGGRPVQLAFAACEPFAACLMHQLYAPPERIDTVLRSAITSLS